MKKRNIIKVMAMALVIVMSVIGIGCSSLNKEGVISNIQPLLNEINESKELDFSGIWKTTLYEKDDLKISFDSKNQKVAVSSKKRGYTNYTISIEKYDGENILILLPHNLYYEVFLLKKNGDNLTGYYLWDKDKVDVTFEKISDEPAKSDTTTKEFSLKLQENAEYLKVNSKYGKDNADYTFTYEMNNKEIYKDIIDKFNLDEITKGKNDIELMEALLGFVCDNFKHSSKGSNGTTNSLEEVMEQRDNNIMLNCKELSYTLAELLRIYGVEAKYIRCLPKEDLFNDCHVVVHAYSKEKNQWIMLDPTYRLILKDKKGNYMNIQSYKKWIIDNGKELENMSQDDENYLIYNKDAGHTGTAGKFNLFTYTEYMAKNLAFIESCNVNLNGVNWGSDKRSNIYLATKGFVRTGIYETLKDRSNKIITTDEENFFRVPLE